MATEEQPSDLVLVRPKDEPDTAPARMTREAFDTIYKDKGFVVVGNDGQPVTGRAAAKAGDAK